MNWETLIPLLEKHKASPEFIAECVYAYIINYGMRPPGDDPLLNELVVFLQGSEK